MKRIVFALMTLVLTVSCTTVDQPTGDAQTPRQRYTGEVGESAVGVIPDAIIRDDRGNRDLKVNIEYPTRSSNNPLIVFSHGFGGSNRAYVALSAYWASQGYVVIKPLHSDGEGRTEASALGDAWTSQGREQWSDRARDLTLILDALDSLEQRYPEFTGKVDRDRIGIGGHSYGAHTAMLLAGARTFPDGTSYADPRVKAAVLMSPQGPGALRGLTAESFATIKLPTLFMTGSRDEGMDESETPAWRTEAFRLAPAGDKWLAVVQGASQASFTGRRDDLFEVASQRQDPMIVPDPTRSEVTRETPRVTRGEAILLRERDVFNSIKVVSLAFWDAYLRGDAEGREMLERGRGNTTLETK